MWSHCSTLVPQKGRICCLARLAYVQVCCGLSTLVFASIQSQFSALVNCSGLKSLKFIKILLISNHVFQLSCNDACRYNFEKVLVNCRHNIYGTSICCTVRSYPDYKFYSWYLYCVYIYASGNFSIDLSFCHYLFSYIGNLAYFLTCIIFLFSSFHLFQRLRMNHKMSVWNWQTVPNIRGRCQFYLQLPCTIKRI